jgi:glycerophosphoryl diester phosphodiesterase
MIKYLKLLRLWFKEYFSVCPRLPKRYRENDRLFWVTGHRGSPVREIENTIESFDTALREGANSLEMDLSLTKDHKVILWHDWDPNNHKSLLREAGFEPWVKYKPHPPPIGSDFRKPVSQLTLEEFRNNFDYKERYGHPHAVKAEIPTLEEFFKWCSEDKRLQMVFFDIKTPPEEKHLAPVILKILKEHITDYKPKFNFVIETFDKEVFLTMKSAFPEFKYSLDVEPPAGFIIDPRIHSAVRTAIKYKIEYAIAFRPHKVTIANWTTLRRIVKHDIKYRIKYNELNNAHCVEYIIGATINKRKELKCLVKMGVGGIQTDFPGRLRRIAERYKKVLE